MTEEEKLAYLGGIIDGEGTVGIERVKRDGKRGRGDDSYHIRLTVANTDRKLISWLKEQFGGEARWDVRKKKNENWAETHEWRKKGERAFKLLQKVEEFIVIKKGQVELAETFWKKTNKNCYVGNARPRWIKEFQRECYKKMKELNKKGPKLPDEEVRSSQNSTLDYPLVDKQQRDLSSFYLLK